jgi:hypothetical protein
MGMSYYQFLDNIETHYFFPLAIVKDSELSAGTVSVLIRPVTGKFDQAGGLAFGIRNRDNYFVVRINALEGNICLFEFRNGRRHKQVVVERTVDTGVWHRLDVAVEGTRLEAGFNGEPVIRFDTGTSLAGFIGLWTTPDSTTWFDQLVVDTGGNRRTVEF